MKKSNKLDKHYYLVGMLAVKIYTDFKLCQKYGVEPEQFFEIQINKLGYGDDELIKFDTWRAFLYCLFTKR